VTEREPVGGEASPLKAKQEGKIFHHGDTESTEENKNNMTLRRKNSKFIGRYSRKLIEHGLNGKTGLKRIWNIR